jgi:hypothetical protein
MAVTILAKCAPIIRGRIDTKVVANDLAVGLHAGISEGGTMRA